jgi:ABC-type polar amino acid transport system ATPase subunit
MAFARQAADRVIFMDEGVIVEQGTPDAIFRQSINPRLSSFLRNYRGKEA